jgi:hypothetical protein
MKNPRRVEAGKLAYARKKAAQDEADKPMMDLLKNILVCLFIFGFAVFLAAKRH